MIWDIPRDTGGRSDVKYIVMYKEKNSLLILDGGTVSDPVSVIAGSHVLNTIH